MKYENININQSVQSMSVIKTFKRTGRNITELVILYKERQQPKFRLAQNWPHNLHKTTSCT